MNGYVYLILAAFSYASMGVLVKALSTDFEPLTQTFLRLTFSGLLTISLILVTKKHFLLKHKKDYYLMFLMGVFAYTLQIVLFTLALYNTTIGNTLFITSAYPIITALLAYFFLKEKITPHVVLALGLLIISLLLFFTPQNISLYFEGNLYALITAICVAIYIICSRILTTRGNSAETVTLWNTWIAVLITGAGVLTVDNSMLQPSQLSIFLLLLFGFFNFAAFNFMNKGFTTISASVGTMVLMVEPVIGALLGFLFYQEIPTFTFLLGAITLFLAVYIAVFKPKKITF